jgi:hypothetical protein
MSTLFGIGIFSAFAALLVDKIYGSIVDSTSAAANAGRYALFTGTWTSVTTAGGLRHFRNSVNRLKGRSKTVNKFIERTKDQ